ncbi:hypothetical protein Rhow_001261 [Rhodococcus wratislaviensis]|uniref:Uncharacterized protein n=1 Tax=Rhodococcus wratislaviensis TaxID=44752 RepID=A0A402C3U9_RHOWR|nr:hypothetical protein Rhow_001261 [Rhodococcus wratislaviensis]
MNTHDPADGEVSSERSEATTSLEHPAGDDSAELRSQMRPLSAIAEIGSSGLSL